jgi:hypothetical protein
MADNFLGAFFAAAKNRAIRLYLFCLRQKRIPLLSLARLNALCALSGAFFRQGPRWFGGPGDFSRFTAGGIWKL